MNQAADISTAHTSSLLPDTRASHTQALAGVNVVSIALNLPGPACVQRLVSLGATVTKVEPPTSRGGDPMRQYAPAYYDELHQGIKVQTLDLKNPDDRTQFDALLSNADLLVTAQREAALERLKLDWPTLSSQLPKLSVIFIVGSASDDLAGHDLTYLAAAGIVDPPHLPATLFADLTGAERAVTAAFALLRVAEKTGRGQREIVSLGAAAQALSGPHRHGLTSKMGLLAGQHPGYNFYRAEDGWIALAALEPHFAERVQTESGVGFSIAALTDFFKAGNCVHWQRWALSADIPLLALPDLTDGA
jgi:crotonobetainyl-CoA:carnitine CoA-transferase CaiB-like acyl-CoA transferase